MQKQLITVCGVVFMFSAQASVAQMVEPDAVNSSDTAPFIRSALPLDEPRHLCIDLPGHGDRVDVTAAFTVHTCKDGMWNLDQRFQWTSDRAGLEMPQYGLCLAASEAKAGAALVLAECDSDNAGLITEQSRLKFSTDRSLCITIADGVSELTPGGKRFPQRYRARDIMLDYCSNEALERQLWSVSQPLDLDAALLPPSGSLPVDQ